MLVKRMSSLVNTFTGAIFDAACSVALPERNPLYGRAELVGRRFGRAGLNAWKEAFTRILRSLNLVPRSPAITAYREVIAPMKSRYRDLKRRRRSRH
jgi:hypothetical protein